MTLEVSKNKYMVAFEEAPQTSSCKYKTGEEIIDFIKKEFSSNYVSRNFHGTGFVVIETEAPYSDIVKNFGFVRKDQKPLFIGFVCPLPADITGFYDSNFWGFLHESHSQMKGDNHGR